MVFFCLPLVGSVWWKAVEQRHHVQPGYDSNQSMNNEHTHTHTCRMALTAVWYLCVCVNDIS